MPNLVSVFTRLSAVALALVSVACVSEENDPGALEFRTTPAPCVPGEPGCDMGNSPEVNAHPLAELALDGTPNERGQWVSGIRSPQGVVYALGTHQQELAAYAGATRIAAGDQLVGWSLVWHHPDGDEEAPIVAVDLDAPSWAANGQDMSTYTIDLDPPGVAPCPVVTIVVGETYDRDDKTVHAAPGWITLACEQDAVYKMKRMNYGPLDDFDGLGAPATREQRQATLKMITADYCGDGLSFTTHGTHVLWKNRAGTVDIFTGSDEGTALEAVWNEDGALCLGTPRNPAAYAALAAAACPLPSCDAIDLADVDHEWVTWAVLAPAE